MLSNSNKFWREAATLLLISKSHSKILTQRSPFDYKVLMLERSSKSKFMPRACVFPGGAISKSDHSQDWIDIFSEAGYSLPTNEINQKDCPMFTESRDWPIQTKSVFKINAIRETFEESGILLYRNWIDNENKLDKSVLKDWKSEVYNNDIKFLEMCKDLKIIPDIWNMRGWSNWLTPTNMEKMHSGKRFDTAFFICLHHKMVDAIHDEQEIVSSNWYCPLELLEDYKAEKLLLAPPQVYEIRRLLNYKTFDSLQKFIHSRPSDLSQRFLPVRMNCDDITIAVLPGDDLYPDDSVLDIEGKNPAPDVGCSSEESRKIANSIHRFEFHNPFDCRLWSNVTQTFGMPAPKLDELD